VSDYEAMVAISGAPNWSTVITKRETAHNGVVTNEAKIV